MEKEKRKENNIIFKIDTDQPLSVESFTKSLIAINDEFKSFSGNNGQLEIVEIRKGSYEIEFLVHAVAPLLFSSASMINDVVDFVSHIKNIKNFLMQPESNNKNLDRNTIENAINMTNPIINNYGTINIITNNEEVSIINEEAKKINENGLAMLTTPSAVTKTIDVQETLYTKVLFYWHQTGFDKKNPNKGNKGIVKSIQKNPVKVIFEDDNSDIKREMTTSINKIDWQKRGYLVDIEVIRQDDTIVKYKILHNHMKDSVIYDDIAQKKLFE